MIYILMGVCGSGKTTIGTSLAEQLNSVFRDADSFHTDENKKKMASGMPLTDEDRLPWLLAIHDFLKGFQTKGQTVVITCSALKKVYRQILRYGKRYSNIQEICETENLPIPFKLVYLKGEEAVLRDRMQKRTGHFMSSGMLSSQLVTMEEPDDIEECLIIDIRESVNTIVKNILQTS
ncbi:probable gluconokinase isoform X1 [Patella vulgata]|uniref:probable gluconokinase isoform X1 n=1 Tax=Patella vulgata TaxID=6465 RepID=UPI00217F3324|nr:probable gluconokinase isoform X1 [Patella vulgata]